MNLNYLKLSYHNLKHNEKSSYLTTFASQFGRYSFTTLLFGVALDADMFKPKINEAFRDLPNAFVLHMTS